MALTTHDSHPSPQELSPATRRAIVLLSFATFSSMALQRICDPMLPELSRVFHAPLSEVSQVISWFAITYGLMQLFYGPVGDRFGKYRVVMLACMTCSAACVLAACSTSLEFLVTARVASALAAAAIIPLSLAWVGDVVQYQLRQETLARVGLGTMLGIAAGQLFGGLLTDTFGWQWAFVLMACAFATVSVLLGQQLAHLEPTPQSNQVQTGFLKQLRQVADDPWVRTILAIALVEGTLIFGLLAVTASHLHHLHHISLTLAGGTTALFGLGGMAYMAMAKWVIRRLGEVGLARQGGIAFGFAFLVIAICPWWQLALPACFCAGFGFAMLHNTMQAKATQMVPTARATGVTLFAGFLFLGQSMGVLLLSALISRFDSRWVVASAGLCVVMLGLSFARAITHRNKTHADHA
ncbi:MAG: MFS transporter [Limnohabitans sp.]|nr:MFS transporter [Limnohabitans sp.]